MTHRGSRALVAVAYLAIGIGVYAGILKTYFVADDFSYLDAIQTATSPAVASRRSRSTPQRTAVVGRLPIEP
jgi:hypothetical protein